MSSSDGVICTTCPHCGYDLQALQPFDFGDLSVSLDGADILWKGKRVDLTPAERLIVLALTRSGGAIVKRAILAEVAGYEGENTANIVAVWITKTKRKFRVIDPTFDNIETVWRDGIRWAA